jgi:hypothetical protein
VVGEKLQVGRELYQFDNNGFHDWIERSRLDQGRIFGAQQERTAAMTIYRLTVHGYTEDEENAIPEKLDLSACKRARPTDIIKWARENQPHLFDDLRHKRPRRKGDKKPAPKDDEAAPDDGIPDLGGNAIGESQWVSDLKAENVRLPCARRQAGSASETARRRVRR